MKIKPIGTKADHRAALKEIETLMQARPGTSEGKRLDVLVTLVEAWERKRKTDEYERAYRAFLAEKPLKMKGRTLTREEANDRAGLRRRRQRPPEQVKSGTGSKTRKKRNSEPVPD